MTLQDFRELYGSEPFRPFVMHLANGRQVGVEHPDFVAVPPVGRTVVVFSPQGRMHIVDLLLVTDLEADQPSDGEMTPPIIPPDPGRRG